MQQDDLVKLVTELGPGQTLVCEAEAGSGKTWAVMQAIYQMPQTATVFISAPTHVAVDELREKLVPGTKCDVIFGTTAKLVGRFLQMNKKTRELENQFAPVIPRYDLIVMDEISAVPSCDVHRALMSMSPMIMLGDREQLAAVKSKQAAVWTDDWAEYQHRSFTFVGLEGQRRASGPMYDFIKAHRTHMPPLTRSFDGVRVLYTPADFANDFIARLRTAYLGGEDLSQFCYFAYKNATVDAMQLRLRAEVFGSDEFVIGETLRVSSAEGLATGQLLTVLSSTKSQVLIAGEVIPVNHVEVKLRSGEERALKAIHPMFLVEFNAILEQAKLDADWDKFFLLESYFAVLVNGNAMTTHKAQGRTVDFVWVDVNDIGSRRKLLYVAYGRAAKQITGIWDYKWPGTKKLLAGHSLEQLTAAIPQSA